jgi:hypothetical protein
LWQMWNAVIQYRAGYPDDWEADWVAHDWEARIRMFTFLDASTHPKWIPHVWVAVAWVAVCLKRSTMVALVEEEVRLLAMAGAVLEVSEEVEEVDLGLVHLDHLGAEDNGSASHHRRKCDTTIAVL